MSINNVEIINNFVLTNVCDRHIIVVEQQNHATHKKGGRNMDCKKVRDWFKKQPNTIFINDVEIPSYQNCWKERTKIERKIRRLIMSSAIQGICIILLSIAVVILAQK